MLKETQLEGDALWKKRYRAEKFWSATIAAGAPTRGLVVSSDSGAIQLYAWDVTLGTLRQLTHSHNGVDEGLLSPDGNYVYYVRDEGGSERGHFVRIPWEGGAEQDLTPDMPPYSSLYRTAISRDGARFAFTPTEANGFPLYCLELAPDGAVSPPRE